MDSAKRVISGTWGEVWLDGDKVSECYGLQAKVSFNKEDIALCGQMASDKKVTSIECTGSLRMHKVTSRMALAIGENIRKGKDVRFTIVSKLKDPDAYGAERVVLSNVSFDDLTLADWEAKSVGKVECPFTFTDYEFLDEIGV
ncbi:phage tail tube protein [Intestinimonas butyriciproducens]|uniref:phage tail tube protein n=1 Tax=Intestinimonas butyriciproducens TaxID=1297617 RepID=UPI00095360FC|nr:phage tail tube protein [Intestinimonas butyriciproducens]MDB7861068.1 phage tail tube protein [Intestinimonas butyriciproducens]MDB7863916.1 phage tail tube protein [Intestinimonas butyriciproducens]OLR67249.1 phage portal protein [Intestinimonas butyriciproducens]